MSTNQDPVDQSVNPVDEQSKAKDSVSLETHRKLLEEKKKAQAQLEALLAEKKAREEDDLRRKGDYQKLEESIKQELEAERRKREELENMFEHGKKLNAVTDALGNIDSKWLKLLDVSQIVVHPDTGEIDKASVARVAESFRKEFPEAIRKPQSNLPNFQPQGLENGSGRIAESAWRALPTLKEMNKWKREQIIWGQ